jgi:hypothetical protein
VLADQTSVPLMRQQQKDENQRCGSISMEISINERLYVWHKELWVRIHPHMVG